MIHIYWKDWFFFLYTFSALGE